MDKICVLLTSARAWLPAGLYALLETHASVEILSESAKVLETVTRLRQAHPSVVIIDVPTDADATFAVIQALTVHEPGIKIIALSGVQDPALTLRLLRSGVRGYLCNQEVQAELVKAVEIVSQGQVYLCPSASKVLVAEYRMRDKLR